MSIFGALFSGVSGLGAQAQAQAMGMLADNITNVNTTGYKETSARFSSLVTASAVISKHSPGGVQSTPQQFIDRQGLLTASASPTDLAINGQGFMIVSDVSAPTAESQEFLTRAGSFTADKDGFLRNAGGYYLRGWEYATGATSADKTTLKTVKVTDFPSTWQATSNVSIQANLKASQTGAAGALTYDGSITASNMASGAVTPDFTRGLEVTDSLGSARTLTFSFLKGNRTALADAGAANAIAIVNTPVPTAYEAGQMFRFTKGTTNTAATTLNVNALGAKALESAGAARTLDLVAGARTHLVLPKRELFQRDTREPSASVILTMRGGRRLEANQVLAIQHLVAAAVPQLMPSRISIVDDQGALLARGVVEDIAGGGGVSRIDEFRIAFERRLKTNIETMLERSLGAGKVWAEVSVDLNHDQVTRNEEFFDPNGQVVQPRNDRRNLQ